MIDTTVTRNQAEPTAAVAPRTASALVVNDLHKTYRQGFWGRRAKPAVAGVSFAVPRGSVFALLGHNGAGKTTTMKALLGLIRPDRGTLTIEGVDANRPASRARVGYLPESPHFPENLSVRELLDYYGRLYTMPAAQRRARIDACLAQVQMSEFAGRRVGACSKGMRQRVGLAQALLNEPAVLILDEPQSGLDPLGRKQVREILLAQKRAGVTILFSSHIVPDVEAVADQVAMLHHGRLTEIRDLAHTGAATRYRARIRRPAAGSEAARLLAGCTVDELDAQRCDVTVADAGELGNLLVACAADAVEVLHVASVDTDLESDFLAKLGVGS